MNKNYVIIGIIVVLIIISIVAGVVISKKGNNRTEENTSSVSETAKETSDKKENDIKKEEDKNMLTGKHNVEIKVKDYGTIALELDADVAPITVTNFIKLVKEGFYDGLTYHRIISGFMIQGGDPLGNGTGGSKENIKGEFSSNGVKNTISHKRGVISMARSSMPNSASSQFFIVHEDSEFLDGQYAAFGHVTSGMEVVDEICKKTPVVDNNGTVTKQNQPIIEKITVAQ